MWVPREQKDGFTKGSRKGSNALDPMTLTWLPWAPMPVGQQAQTGGIVLVRIINPNDIGTKQAYVWNPRISLVSLLGHMAMMNRLWQQLQPDKEEAATGSNLLMMKF